MRKRSFSCPECGCRDTVRDGHRLLKDGPGERKMLQYRRCCECGKQFREPERKLKPSVRQWRKAKGGVR